MRSVPWLLAFLVVCLGAGALAAPGVEASSKAEVSPKTQKSIGVAPFERAGADRGGQPDVAALLARRLSTRGVERVVGPGELNASALADPRADQVVEWGDRAGVSAVVVGRTTRIGARLSVDARLRDAVSGDRLGRPFYAEVARPEELADAVDDLAGEVLGRFEQAPAPVPAVAAAPASSAPKAAGPRDPEPISIRSDELEAVDRDGQKRFLFVGNVKAEQGALVLKADRLEAFYPPGASQPDRLVAEGKVVIVEGERTAHCRRATLLRSQDRVVCTGNARLEQACDHVSGREIVFYLDREVLKVTGSADVRVHPRGAGCDVAAGAAP